MKSPFTGILLEIAEIEGDAVADKIAKTYGGVRVTFPATPHDEHWLVKLVGRDCAARICRHFAVGSPCGRMTGIREVILPIGKYSSTSAARKLALQSLQAGCSVREAALAARVHERSVFRYRAEFKRQGLLA